MVDNPPPNGSDVPWLDRSQVRGKFPENLLIFPSSRWKGGVKREAEADEGSAGPSFLPKEV